uniref:Uncharacterized protein n=1 Tax=Rhizophora mucronata TaxID=61149 RepID=A0A2P2Q8H6_RHIMU
MHNTEVLWNHTLEGATIFLDPKSFANFVRVPTFNSQQFPPSTLGITQNDDQIERE